MSLVWDPLLSPLQLGLLFAPPALALLAALGWAAWRREGRGALRAGRRLLALVLLFVAALGPGYGTTTTKVVLTDADVFLVMDTTTSANAEDWDASGTTRLEAMKQDAVAILEHYAGSRYSLITFDSAAITRLPLVRDPIALRSVLDTLDVEITANAGGGDIGRAAALLERRLRESREDHPERVQLVFYLGDGEQTATTPPTSFSSAGEFVQRGAVLGYGTALGGRMRENDYVPYDWEFSDTPPVDDGQPAPYVKDGAVDAVSRIDEGNLRAVASQLGVGYQHRLPGTAPTLPGIEGLLGQEVEVADVQIAFPYYWLPAVPAFALIAWDVLLVVGGLGELLAARRGMRA
ncbi:MAG: VWA domain-containing protein [Actinomycetales bacterium]|nr:VWA domain-containing protein [Actinomycetales bacterium]